MLVLNYFLPGLMLTTVINQIRSFQAIKADMIYAESVTIRAHPASLKTNNDDHVVTICRTRRQFILGNVQQALDTDSTSRATAFLALFCASTERSGSRVFKWSSNVLQAQKCIYSDQVENYRTLACIENENTQEIHEPVL